MLSWILIAIAIAIIFGVIKIDDIKSQSEKALHYIKQILSTVVSWSKNKTAEVKSIAEQKKLFSSENQSQEKDNSSSTPIEGSKDEPKDNLDV